MIFCYGLDQITCHGAEELSTKISAILGYDYVFPDGRGSDDFSYGTPTIPSDATDEQARAIADLFALKFAYVVETEFA